MSALMLDVRLKRASKVYREGEVVAGVVVVESRSDCTHNGVSLVVDGMVNLQLSAKSVGVFEAFYNSAKPIHLISQTLEIGKAGKFPSGKTEIPFEIPLKVKLNKKLYETYHGVFINIMYIIKVDMKRGLLAKDLHKETEFIVETKKQEKPTLKSLPFELTPEGVKVVKDRGPMPKFKITGSVTDVHCTISQPFSGELVVEHCDTPIRSIELQLTRIETCGCAEGYAKEATEIQNIQVADGDVCHGISIPLHMTFPRLFTCPSLTTNNFKIEFEVNLVVIFRDDRLVTETFPIKLFRVD